MYNDADLFLTPAINANSSHMGKPIRVASDNPRGRDYYELRQTKERSPWARHLVGPDSREDPPFWTFVSSTTT
jgi:hypothetical protein